MEFDDLLIMAQQGYRKEHILSSADQKSDEIKIFLRFYLQLDGERADNRTRDYSGLRQFCLDWGFIAYCRLSIFSSAKSFRVNLKIFGTMYTQLGMMAEAAEERTLLIGRPLICHRTATM